MPDFSGLWPVPPLLPGQSPDRHGIGTAMHLRQTEVALGRTVGAGGPPMTGAGITGVSGASSPGSVGPRRTGAAPDIAPPDPDAPAGPPPAFDITPLEKLRDPAPKALAPPEVADAPPHDPAPRDSAGDAARPVADADPYADARIEQADHTFDLRH